MIPMKKLFKPMAAAIVSATIGLATQSAIAGNIFTVQESAATGAAPNLITADQFSLDYQARVTQDAFTGPPAAFQESGFFDVTSYLKNLVTQGTQLNLNEALFSGAGYHLWAVFHFSGTATINAANDIVATFNPTSSLSLFLDPKQNDTLTLPALGSGSVSVTDPLSDDIQIGTASIVTTGKANIRGGFNLGDYKVLFGDFALTTLGKTYFTSPDPFFMSLQFSGNTNSVAPPLTSAGGTALLEGAGKAEFFAPEPSEVALMAIGLIVAGGLSRKKRPQLKQGV